MDTNFLFLTVAMIPAYALGCSFGVVALAGAAKVVTALLGNGQELQDKP